MIIFKKKYIYNKNNKIIKVIKIIISIKIIKIIPQLKDERPRQDEEGSQKGASFSYSLEHFLVQHTQLLI